MERVIPAVVSKELPIAFYIRVIGISFLCNLAACCFNLFVLPDLTNSRVEFIASKSRSAFS